MNVVIDGIKYTPVSEISMMPRSFGEFLYAARKGIKLSLYDASKNIGCSKSYIWEMEHDKAEPSFRMAKRISCAYGIPLITLASYLPLSDTKEFVEEEVSANKA